MDGKFVFVQGEVTWEGSCMDSQFGVETGNSPIMARRVEVYCYSEKKKTVEEKHGDMKRTQTVYDYKLGWQSTVFYKSSKNFKNKAYDKNVDPDLKPVEFSAPTITLDNSDNIFVNARDIASQAFAPIKHMYIGSDKISALVDSKGIWMYDKNENCFVRQRNPGQDTIGDIRVTYLIAPDKIRQSYCGIYSHKDRTVVKHEDLKVSFVNEKISQEKFLNKHTIWEKERDCDKKSQNSNSTIYS